MSHVMSLIVSPMSIGFMSHVDFKKWPCHPVEFKGQGPPRSHCTSRRGKGLDNMFIELSTLVPRAEDGNIHIWK